MHNLFVHPSMAVPSFHSQWPVPHGEGFKVAETTEDPWFRPPDEVEPNETLYVNNINTRVKERDVKLFMERIFKAFGTCRVTAMSSLARRGQAWITYESIEQATSARVALHGTLAFGKKLRVSFAKSLSDLSRERKGLPRRIKRSSPFTKAGKITETAECAKGDGIPSTDQFFRTDTPAPRIAPRKTLNPPNRVLFIENIPQFVSEHDLKTMFSGFEGFIEVRSIPTRGVAFVEFENETTSHVALVKVSSIELKPNVFLDISFGKR